MIEAHCKKYRPKILHNRSHLSEEQAQLELKIKNEAELKQNVKMEDSIKEQELLKATQDQKENLLKRIVILADFIYIHINLYIFKKSSSNVEQEIESFNKIVDTLSSTAQIKAEKVKVEETVIPEVVFRLKDYEQFDYGFLCSKLLKMDLSK